VPRRDGRANDELRPVDIQVGYQEFAEGSALIQVGQTRVICSASVEERVPGFLRGEGKGWITAEYGMLPRSTLSRTPRERGSGKSSGRVQEIQRLIGRSLRAIVDLKALGERTVTLDCDVLQADGGTRTAAVTGAYVALHQALTAMVRKKVLRAMPLHGVVAATSVGVVGDALLLDLNYEEDFRAKVDFNVVMSDSSELIEVQGTAEEEPFSRRTMDHMVDLAQGGIQRLVEIQREALGGP
jgi:ribonuclease PH